MSIQRSHGRGVSRFVQELARLADRRASLIATRLELATAIDDETISLDLDGYILYRSEKDFVVFEDVQFEAGDRLVVSTIGGTRGTVVILGIIQKRPVDFVTFNSGLATIPSSGPPWNVVIAHGLSLTPVLSDFSIIVGEDPIDDFGHVWIDTIGDTNFTVNIPDDPGASGLDFGWRVDVRE